MPHSLTFAVPVTWDSTRAYGTNVIVFVGKKAYTSIQDVPTGINIDNTSYWIETGVKDIDLTAIEDAIDALEIAVDDNTDDITQAQADIVTNANNITSLTTQLAAAVASISANAQRLDNIMITLYTPTASS